MIAVVRALSALEPRHWAAVGGSVALHLGVIFGWQPDPPQEPQPLSFEITLEPANAKSLPAARTKAIAKKTASRKLAQKTKAKKLATKKKPQPDLAQREPHLITADWRTEAKASQENSAPALALPDAHALGIESHIPMAQQVLSQANNKSQAKRAAETAARATPSVASDSSPGLSEPSMAPPGNESGRLAETSVSLVSSPALMAGQGISPTTGSGGAQASSTAASLAGSAGAAGSGDRQGSLQAASTPQAALSSASGAGMQRAASSTTLAAQGARPDGVRLTASSALANIAALPAGAGALAAGASTTTLAQAGQAPSQTAHVNPAAGNLAGGALRGSPVAIAGTARTTLARAGSGQASPGETATGRSGQGQEARGQLGVAAHASTALMGIAHTGVAPGRSGQTTETIALAPGEPGSSPRFAVTLQPVVATHGNPYLQTRAGQAAGAGSSEPFAGSGRATAHTAVEVAAKAGASPIFSGAPVGVGNRLATDHAASTARSQPGISAASAQAAAAAVLNAAREAGHAPVVLQAVQAVPVKVVRPDTEIQRLDVLAPSNYCPLPLPGHNQPANRAPQAQHNIAEQPAYALDNPSISYPVLANIRGVEGRVTVRVEVLADGRPGKMWLKQSSGSGILDHDAQDQLKHWRFMPARKGGQPVSAWIDIPVLYRLSESR